MPHNLSPDPCNLYSPAARHYHSALSIWLSVDPMADKYPGVSPYTYCGNNPVRLVNEDDREGTIPPWLWGPAIAIVKGTARIVETCSKKSDIKTAAYAINHPINAFLVKSELNVAATNFQINVGRAINCPQNTEGSPQNAIRHTLWQALITRDCGENQAKRIGNAHEDNIHVNTNQRNFSSLLDADRVVDLLNNEIGRTIGKKYSSSSNKDMAKMVMKEYYQSGLWTAEHNDDGSYTVVKTRISTEQYNAAIKEINKKGENGLNQ